MGGQAGGRASDRARAPGRPGGWACTCTMRAHTRWSGGLGGQMHRQTSNMCTFQPDRSLTRTNFPNRNPAPRTPHPAPCTRYPMLYPCTPHPAPYTLYPLPYRAPETPNTGHTAARLCGEGVAKTRGTARELPGSPPVFSPPHRISVPACVLYYKNKNRCFPTQFSPPHRNMLYALLVHGPQETQFLGLSQVFQVFFKMYQATHFQDPPI